MSVEGSRVALIVACDRYADPDLKQLQAPTQDAEAFARILKDPKIGGFNVSSLINTPHGDLREKINEFLDSCGKEDTLLLYFSCHGIKDKNGRLYFATITTNRKRLPSTGIDSNFVNEMLDNCRAQQKVVLLDCCYSGAFEKGRFVRADTQVNATTFFGEGRVIITASDEMQYAFEGDDKKELERGGSYFTNALIEGLETGKADVNDDGKITYSELYNYIHDYVRRITPDQTPTLNTRGVKGDFEIFKNIRDNLGSSEAKPPAATGFTQDTGKREVKDSLLEYIEQAWTFLDQEQYDKAIKKFDGILALSEGHIEALNGKGLALSKQEKFEEALECFKEVLQIKPKDAQASIYVDLITRQLGRERSGESKAITKEVEQDTAALEKRTEEKVKKALSDSTQIPSELIKKGDQFYEKAMYQEAILCYDKALKIEPRSESALIGKGSALYSLREYEEAIKSYDKAIEIDPKLSGAWFNKGLALSNLGKHEEAIKSYDKAIEIDPENTDAWNGKGSALFDLGKHEEAIKSYDKAIELKPDDAYAWNNKGSALFDLGKHEEAIKSYDKAIELKPDDISAWYDKVNVLYHLGKYKEAIDVLNKVLESEPDNVKDLINKGVALNTLSKYEEASTTLDRVLKLQPNNVFALIGKGYSLDRLTDYEGAIECYGRALEIDPNNKIALRRKIQVLRKRDRARTIKGTRIHSPQDLDHAVPYADPRNPYNDPTLPYYNPKLSKPTLPYYNPKLSTKGDSEQQKQKPAEQHRPQPVPYADPRNPYNDPTLPYYNPKLSNKNESSKNPTNLTTPYRNEAHAWYNKGIDLNNYFNYKEAVRCFDKAIKIDPGYADAWEGKAYALERLLKAKEANKAYETARKLRYNG